MSKWAIELGEHEINFPPRHSIKGQVIADFLVELPSDMVKQGETTVTRRDMDEFWELYTDGASSKEGAGIGILLVSPNGEEITYVIQLMFATSKNEAEYEALIARLRLAKSIDVQQLKAYIDSQLVASQLNSSFEARDTSMQKYLELTKTLTKTLAAFEIKQIPRNRNKKADALSKLASLLYDHFTKKVMVEVLERKSTDEDTLVATITTENEYWMTPFIKYLANGTLPEDKLQARRIRMRAPMYNFKDGIMYRKSFTEPYLRCVGPAQAKEIIQEMHEGACLTHFGYQKIVSRIKRMGYFWPHMYRDTYDLIINCEACQIHAPVNRSPRRNMVPIHAAWLFCKWGIDIVGPFPRGVGNVKFLVVAIDYFTKWVEARPLSTITGRKILTFVWEDIVYHFCLPREIVSDNGTQFAHNPFKDWCIDMDIQQSFTSMAYPQANGQVEVTNRDSVASIKARLSKHRQGWVDELQHVLWAHRTTPKDSTNETPFSMVYGTEAVILAEMHVLTNRITTFDEQQNDETL
ncbi:uncharacterized protein [Rutidosis leptorrhynchoides]|uniref:uncharacterized protein n=1 Tax=Rutidosis leptorrhynchoides TaxID=125765 RepID=UPI003A9A5602